MPAVVPARDENAMSKPSFGSSSCAFGSLLLKQSRVRGRWDFSRSVTKWSPPKYPLSVGSGGVTMEALERAFVEATGFNLDPEQYGFSVPAFVRTLAAKWQQLEPSGQFVITLAEPEGPGTVAPPREAGAVAPHPSVWEEAAADLLVSLPQPRRQPKCFPQGLFGPCSAAQQPGVGSPEAQSLRVFSPESAPRQSPPAYAPCPPERPLVPPVELEGPFQMRDGLSTECSPVFVSHIYSAHHFYIQHMDGDTACTLEWLMRAACTGWYESLITAEDLSVGMPCVAPYTYGHGRTVWLRGVVYGFDAEDDRYAPLSDDPVDTEVAGLTNKELKAIVSRLQAFREEQVPSQEEELPHVLGSLTLAAAVVA